MSQVSDRAWLLLSKAAAGMLFLFLLAACSSPPEVVIQKVFVYQEIDPGLLSCADFPAKPAGQPSYSGLVQLLFEAKAAWVDCSYKLGEVERLVHRPPPGERG